MMKIIKSAVNTVYIGCC